MTDIKALTIRYYEQIGLLPSPARTEANRRSYHPAAGQHLMFIRHSRDLGFNIDEIRTLLKLRDDPHQLTSTQGSQVFPRSRPSSRE